MEENIFDLNMLPSRHFNKASARLTSQFKQYLQTQAQQFIGCESSPAYKYLPYADHQFHHSVLYCWNSLSHWSM